MPQYMMLIYLASERPVSQDAQREQGARWADYTQELKDAGLFVAGDALQGVEVATTVRERDGQPQITDGPFAETREVLGGYYLLDAPDLDTVLGRADHAPHLARGGSVEIRPVAILGATQSSEGRATTQA